MEKRNIIFKVFQALILCGLIWICFMFARLALVHSTDNQEIFAPQSAKSILTIKADTLFSESFLSLIFNRDDEEQVALISSLKEKIKTNESEQKWNFGIDLSNDIQIFSDEIDGNKITGIIFRLNDTDLWDENSNNLLSGNVISNRKESTGLLLQSQAASIEKLNQYYKKHSFSKNENQSDETISYRYQNQKNHSIKNIESSFSFEKKHISAKFSSDFGKEIKTGIRKFELTDGGLHIQSSYIPKFLNDTLRFFYKKYDIDLPKIRSIDLKYDGIELASTNSGVLPLPTIEAIIEFEVNFSISDFIQKMAQNNQKTIQFDEKSFIIAKKTYFFKQLDQNTIYIGSTKKPKIFTPERHDLISISGDPKMLSNIQGNRFVTGLVKMNEDFKKLEGILNRLDNIDIRINRKNESELLGLGKLEFIDKRKTMDELVKMMLSLF